ncbi:S41 family peptidase [Elizabethkingia sp. HX WHF]|uniref:S41 family peptidase n=1 Tax=Elizabethkingia TaxID=308865 RepID=UPI000999B2A9|nr:MULTISPECIES: S41 family peptidase [Elizabethkingia]RBI91252.1 peptidase S41 [Elizabethkingia miricola]MCL1639190.1 S41 family peptidase [Elizabethkingia bruuniana]MDX8565853.1 S41 family peptidase [Elizabethkingia sp. HX WHF]OPC26816.1 peptidase S41 [Elizabethkingia bruuniana]OPC65542.1 peptidase S41 [Elizabethkingia bruuniana]
MKRNFIKIPVFALGLALSAMTLNSCVKDEETSITEPTRYTSNDVKSYADLFKVFWTVMDQRYNYFYEQKRADGMDWNAVYREYYPKFAALKTFGKSTDNDKDINDDKLKAAQYFTDIIDPIIDRHFNVKIAMPASNNNVISTFTFWGGMKTKGNNIYPFNAKYGYMKNRLAGNALMLDNFLLAGNLKSNPDIYYFSFAQFALTSNLKIDLLDKYLTPDTGNGLLLTTADIDASKELGSIKDVTFRNKVRDFTVNILNQWNSFPASAEVKAFNDQIAPFKTTEVISDAFLDVTQKALTKSKNLVAYNSAATYAPILTAESIPYIQWFMSKMGTHVQWGYRLPQFQDAAQGIINKAPLYKNFFNPLKKGDIKKIIIDLRGNGGGAIVDARFFTDRFITKPAVWGYQRTKEGNGQFNYTPWVPMQANPHQFGLPSNIPIVILTDKGSASMSEMSTMMIKTQGSQVISVGDYSAGATAGLGSPDDFNGGTRDQIAGYLTFYMPLMAAKDASGQVIEGVGVKPDIFVEPPTDAEVAAMQSSPNTFVDRVLNEAVKYLSGK